MISLAGVSAHIHNVLSPRIAIQWYHWLEWVLICIMHNVLSPHIAFQWYHWLVWMLIWIEFYPPHTFPVISPAGVSPHIHRVISPHIAFQWCHCVSVCGLLFLLRINLDLDPCVAWCMRGRWGGRGEGWSWGRSFREVMERRKSSLWPALYSFKKSTNHQQIKVKMKWQIASSLSLLFLFI